MRTSRRLQRMGLLAALAMSSTFAMADTLRCGSELVSTGDRSFEVERKCGQPTQRDFIGYTLGPNERREMAREEWIYGPRNGVFSILTFEGNRLIQIETSRAN